MESGGFEFWILNQSWHNLTLGYEAQKAQDILRTIRPDKRACMITTDDIESYTWSTQSILLTEEATHRLAEAVLRLKPLSPGAEKLKALKSSLGYENSIERALYTCAFAVYFDLEYRYGGIFLDAMSQMAINFPVARTALKDDKVHISLIPVHIPFVTVDPIQDSPPENAISIAKEMQPDAQQLDHDGFLTGWIRNLGNSTTAVDFRNRIREPRIREAMSAAGKLRLSDTS